MVYTINQVSNETDEKCKGSIWKELVFAFMGKSLSYSCYLHILSLAIFWISDYFPYLSVFRLRIFFIRARVCGKSFLLKKDASSESMDFSRAPLLIFFCDFTML